MLNLPCLFVCDFFFGKRKKILFLQLQIVVDFLLNVI